MKALKCNPLLLLFQANHAQLLMLDHVETKKTIVLDCSVCSESVLILWIQTRQASLKDACNFNLDHEAGKVHCYTKARHCSIARAWSYTCPSLGPMI